MTQLCRSVFTEPLLAQRWYAGSHVPLPPITTSQFNIIIMRFSIPAAVLLLATAVGALEDTPKKSSSTSQAPPACTATAGSGGSFFDLRPDTAHKPDSAKGAKSGVTKDYHARGFDYGKNFTLNVCGAVVDAVTDVVGVNKQTWANVSAYYTSDDKTYSIGFVSMVKLRDSGRGVTNMGYF